jgi:hypothetical protein
MNNETNKPSTKPPGAAMEGGGYYNRNSAMQAAGIGRLIPHLEQAVRTIAIGDEPIVIADYGSSQGRNSMAPMRIAIGEIRTRTGPERVVEVMHTDLPSNDFSALFAALEDDPDSYLAGAVNVFPSAIGRSYFQPIIAPCSVHLGWNTWTMHWMDGEPIEAQDHIIPGFSSDPRVTAAVKHRQASDWRRFLDCRASELRPGGRLISAFTGMKNELSGWEWLAGEFWGAVVDLGKEGVLSRDEQTRLTIPVGNRSVEAISEPFGASGSFAGLRLEHVDTVDVPDPWWPTYQSTGDALALARSLANTTRAWSGPTLARCLGGRPDTAAVIDKLFDQLAVRLAVAPRPHEPFLAVVVLARD